MFCQVTNTKLDKMFRQVTNTKLDKNVLRSY